MTEALYQQALKELAAAAHGAGRLVGPTASIRLDNPLCGDRIALNLSLAGDSIVAIGHETRGCLLCRAAASWLGRYSPGMPTTRILAAHAELRALLEGEINSPTDWPDLAPFSPVRAYKSRHGCVLLPFRAFAAALSQIRGQG